MFHLTKAQHDLSINIYGKIIRCIIAPYHNITLQSELLKVMGSNPSSVYVFPERDLNIQQRVEIISTFVNSKLTEVNFITSDLFIIGQMINDCCRILTPDGKLEECHEKTFIANPHSIIYEILQNKYYTKAHNNNIKTAKDSINDIITEINKAKTISIKRKSELTIKISIIGEQLISRKLLQMLNDIKVV